MAQSGLIIGAASSNAGKTLITTGLLAAFAHRECDIAGAKTGPDYIDPAFHQAACGHMSVNLDPFAMNVAQLCHYARRTPAQHLLIEGVMGLFDGAVGRQVSTSTLASQLNLPIILIMNVRGQSQTAGYIATALARLQPLITGVILNEVGSPRHAALIETVLKDEGLRCFGAVPSHESLAIPSRHLGLVQMAELQADPTWAHFTQQAGKVMQQSCDLDAIEQAFAPLPDGPAISLSPPPAQHITIIRDHAFGFTYQHQIENWRLAGADIAFVSALQDDIIAADTGFVYLPGGYPELHLPQLSQNKRFMTSLQQCAAKHIPIYGECGGYMTLGQAIIDKDGQSYEMAGLLPLVTSYQKRQRHLGYRRLLPRPQAPSYIQQAQYGHEFHFTSAIQETGTPLFDIEDAAGEPLGHTGLIQGTVCGSYCHIIT